MDNIAVTVNLHPDMIQKLARLAEARRVSFGCLVRTALENFVGEEEKEFKSDQDVSCAKPKLANDKRLYPRKPVTAPVDLALRVDQEEFTGPDLSLKDISLGGSLLVLPKEDEKLAGLITQGRHFKIVIGIPGEEEELAIICQARRVSTTDDHMLVGISFNTYNYYDLIKLYKLLE